MNTETDATSALIGGTASLEVDCDRSRLSKWGGLLAALTTTDDFKTVSSDDADIKQMIDTVQRLEASLHDCAVHGHQKVVDAFIACQLTPAILNRCNSPVLDGLWQALTGRTPDGETPFALNPPHDTAELLSRLVWPRSYPEAVDLVVEVVSEHSRSSTLVVSAVMTSACAGRVDILKGLLVRPLDDVAQKYLSDRLPRIAACGHMPCCEVIFPYLIPFGSSIRRHPNPIANALKQRAAAGHLQLVQFLLTHYDFDPFILEPVVLEACLEPSLDSDATFELLYRAAAPLSAKSLSDVLRRAVAFNRIGVAQFVLALGICDYDSCHAACAANLLGHGADVWCRLVSMLSAEHRLAAVREYVFLYKATLSLSAIGSMLESLHDQPRSTVQWMLDDGLMQAVSSVQCDRVSLFLQHGAHARAYDDYIIHLAAVSGRADVMDLLLDAADVDADCAARYRRQMSEPAGLLGVAQHLHERKSPLWNNPQDSFKNSYQVSAALCGGSSASLEWLLTPPARSKLVGSSALVQLVREGNVALVRTLVNLQPNPRTHEWVLSMSDGVRVARETQNFEMIQLLFPQSLLDGNLTFWHVYAAVQANDPFTHRYLFAGDSRADTVHLGSSDYDWRQYGLLTLVGACMTGNLALLENTWRFLRYAFRINNAAFETIDPRIDRAFQLCTDGDLTPVMMVLMKTWNDTLSPLICEGSKHPIVLAARCGHLPAVRLWLAQGIPAQWALSAAVKHGQAEVVSCLIAHGAKVHEEYSSEQYQI